jgi:CBS domain-containing protein
VNRGLEECGFPQDPHCVLARYGAWRMPLSGWKQACLDCLEGGEVERLARAAVAFDYRQVAGELHLDKTLTDIMRDVPHHKRFLRGLAKLGSTIPSPLSVRQRLDAPFDIKKDALVTVENLARYYAFARGITANTTLERLVAVDAADGPGVMSEQTLREAFVDISEVRLQHHARAIREGRPPDNIVDPSALRPLVRVTLQESLRVVAAAQKRFPRLARLF